MIVRRGKRKRDQKKEKIGKRKDEQIDKSSFALATRSLRALSSPKWLKSIK